jgi:hypothetical protein
MTVRRPLANVGAIDEHPLQGIDMAVDANRLAVQRQKRQDDEGNPHSDKFGILPSQAALNLPGF